MTYFSISLQDGSGTIRKLGMLPFASLQAAYQDVCLAIPETAADLIRSGEDPASYVYLISNEDDELLLEVPVARGSVDHHKVDGRQAGRGVADWCQPD